uniref:Uncharacterized protein n=1 Tax=Arundo donax TaxID=35708 RepID=A0A0A9GYJ6_ARUDO
MIFLGISPNYSPQVCPEFG